MKKTWRVIGIGLFWLMWLGLFVLLYRSRRTRVIIISADDSVLLVQGWLSAGQWILPGGGIHEGEEGKAGAIREIQEETGLRLLPDQLTSLGEGRAHEYGLRFGYQVYVVRLSDKPELHHQKGELTDAIWMPLSDLKHLSPLTKRLLSEWRSSQGLLK